MKRIMPVPSSSLHCREGVREEGKGMDILVHVCLPRLRSL